MYFGGSLTSFFGDAAQAATKSAAADMAKKGGDRVREVAEINTPVRSGALRASWKTLGPEPYTAEGSPAYRTSISTDVSYAPFVEYGTGLFGPKHAPYIIKPRNPGGTLRFMVGGKAVFAKQVIHPGSPGNHMMSIALDVTDGEMRDGHLFEDVLEGWTHAVEGAAR